MKEGDNMKQNLLHLQAAVEFTLKELISNVKTAPQYVIVKIADFRI
jgi:hypothetical protein